MKRVLSSILIFSTVFILASNLYAMKSKNFNLYEERLKVIDEDFKVLGEVTLKPGEEKYFEAYTYKPVTIDFKTDVALVESKKCKNEGIGIKKLSNLKYYLKDPVSASMDVLPEDGVVQIALKNFEKFPIKVKLYQLKFNT